MEWWHLLLLAALQGLTEFLPISSSAHLILLPYLFGWDDQGLAFDIAVHVGSLAAVIIYFRATLAQLTDAWWRHLAHGEVSPDSRLAWGLIAATVPVAVAGLLFSDLIGHALRNPMVIAVATLLFGLLLWVADRWATHVRDEHEMGWTRVIVIGFAQALALIPGTSRSGITMTAGLALGLTRSAAARFSFLLSIPVIVLAGGHRTWQLLEQPAPVAWGVLLAATLVSGATAWTCIHFFLKWIERVGMTPFVIYRIVLAIVLFAVFAP